jgi:GT2 family glycosyltransferase
LPVLLEALVTQVVDRPWELVVVVDGEVDETRALLGQWSDRLPLRVIVFEEKRGVSAALAAGYAEAAGEVLIRCDDDLTPRPDFVRRHLDWHTSREDLGVIGLTRDVFPPTPYALVYGIIANDRLRRTASAQLPSQRWVHWAANNSIRRSTWVRSGGFDDRLVYGEDSEFGWRLAAAGVEIVIDPELEVEHRGPTTDVRTRVSRAFVSGASRRLFAQVHPEVVREEMHPSGSKAIVWSAGTRALVRMLRRRESYQRVGGALDRVLPLLPPAVGRRAVAALVESAGRSGQLFGSTALAVYQDQKDAERRRELRSRG